MNHRSVKRDKLKVILFEHKDISRQNLIRLSGANPRTVSNFMAELAQRQLVKMSYRIPERGRPVLYYTLIPENIRILHFTVTKDEIYTAVSDNRGFPLCFFRDAMHWHKNMAESLTGKLKNAAEKLFQQPDFNRNFLTAAGVELALPQLPPEVVCQRISDMLERFFHCQCPVFSVDEYLLSQYMVNNHLNGRAVGLAYRADIQCSAVDGDKIDPELRNKVKRVIASADGGQAVSGFTGFIQAYHKEFLPALKGIEPTGYYNAVFVVHWVYVRYFESFCMLSLSMAIFSMASDCFLRSIAIIFSGALFTKLGLPSLASTLLRNFSW